MIEERLGRQWLADAEQPRLVREQPAHEHLGLAGLREARPVAGHGRVEIDLAGVDEAQQARGRERLRDRVHVHDRVARPRSPGRGFARPQIHDLLTEVVAADRGAGLPQLVEAAPERVGHRSETGTDRALDRDVGHAGQTLTGCGVGRLAGYPAPTYAGHVDPMQVDPMREGSMFERRRRSDHHRAPIVRAVTMLGVALAAVLTLAGPAGAQSDPTSTPTEQIVFSGRLVVAQGETVDSAVIFNGPATIAGRVTESLVVFNGDTVITGTVAQDVVVFNGSLTVRSGATVNGDLVSVDSPTVEPGATVRGDQRRVSAEFDAAEFGFASRLAWWVAYSVSTLLLGLALLGLAPGLDLSLARAARDRTGVSIGLGAAAFFLLPVVAVLLLVIVVAIPLGLFLLLAFALLYTIGYVGGAHVLGRRIVAPPKSRFVAFLAGWAILRGVALIPVLGGLVWMLAAIVGLGALWVAARRSAASPPEAPETGAATMMPPIPEATT